MGSCVDFISSLDPDMSHKILLCLDDPSDLVRVSCVSRSWRRFVIANGLCKQLCLRMFPQLSRAACVVELNKHGAKEPEEVGSSYSMEWQALEKNHRVYAYLARASMTFGIGDCIGDTIGASSTDNFPEESIDNTLEPRDMIGERASYWSSKGQNNPDVPETLTYKLVSQICVITEISVQPFEAFFQPGLPIYSAKSVRIKMGYPNPSLDTSTEEKYVWTYTSPEFPMAQENRLQKFILPEPVLCIGGILQIELLGRVQRQEMDNLFYICVCHVQVVGRPLSPAFSVEIRDHSSGMFTLKCDQLAKCHAQLTFSNESDGVEDDWDEEEVDDFEETYSL
ncbi:F-box protein [Senna tora]|uniref:F-box protein n=1 Tax=Senna tora TaxID=362788 RepID=A0A834T683_9FABA|nr:F-box protein [Senna tora]